MTILLAAQFNLNAENHWINASSGFWSTPANWSQNAIPDGSSGLDPTQITNAGTKTVTIDSATALGNLSLRGLIISAPIGATNTLRVDSAPATLTASKALLINNRGVLQITNSAVIATSSFDVVGGGLILDSGNLTCPINCDLQSGSMIINGGTLVSTQGTTGIRMGRFTGAVTSMTLNGGVVDTLRITLGSVTGSQNSLVIAGGTLICEDYFSAAQIPGTTGDAVMSAGNLIVTNGLTKIGDRAAATFTQKGGNVQLAVVRVGDTGVGIYILGGGTFTVIPRTTNDFCIIGNLENGTFNQTGGVAVVNSELHIADFTGITGAANVSGGQFFATNDIVAIGREGTGSMTVSNSLVVLTNTSVGRHAGSSGTITVQDGATVRFLSDLSIGRFSGASGQALIQGGLLSITNDDVWIGRGGAGDLTVSGGTVRAKSIHVAASDDGINAPSGTFNMTGGTLLVSSNFDVGTSLISTGHVIFNGGELIVTNAAAVAAFAISAGDFTIGGGTVTVDSLRLDSTNGTFVFNSGTLAAKGMFVSNSLPFTVGDGVNPAVLQLQGGTYVFADGLVISPNATVIGCGTVIGAITNNGTFNNSCGSVTPSAPAISGFIRSTGTAAMFCASQTGFNYTLEFKNSLGDPAWTPILPAVSGNGNVINLTDPAATNLTRFYRIRVQ